MSIQRFAGIQLMLVKYRIESRLCLITLDRKSDFENQII